MVSAVFWVCSFLGRGPELPSLCTFRSSFWGQEGWYGQPFWTVGRIALHRTLQCILSFQQLHYYFLQSFRQPTIVSSKLCYVSLRYLLCTRQCAAPDTLKPYTDHQRLCVILQSQRTTKYQTSSLSKRHLFSRHQPVTIATSFPMFSCGFLVFSLSRETLNSLIS